jgi:hypothetical protein
MALQGSAHAATVWYVSPSGSDANPGTVAAPLRTIKKAVTVLHGGDVLYVRGGTYVENATGMSIAAGTAGAPITVAAYPGERPVVQGLLWLTNPSYWILDGLNVTWNPANGPSQHMMKMTGGTGWVVEHAEIWGARSFAGLLVAGTPMNWRVAENCIHDTYPSNGTNQDHLVYANSGLTGTGGVIERNLMFNATNGEAVKLAGPSSTSGGASNVTVRYNTIDNTSQDMLVAWQAHDNAIRDNLLGRTAPNNGAIRGYQVTGTGNVAAHNFAFNTKAMLTNDKGYSGVADAGNNVLGTDPLFDGRSCSAYHPVNAVAATFGRYA